MKKVLGVWMLSKILFYLVLLLGRVINVSVKGVLMSWDVWWYLEILRNGYLPGAIEHNLWVFPPGFPFGARLFNVFVGNELVSLLLVSNLASILGVILFYKFLLRYFDENRSFWGVCWLLFSPVGWILSLGYTESLFFLLSTMVFFSLERKRLDGAAFVLAVVPLVRYIGIVHWVPFLFSIWKVRLSFLKRFIYVFIGVLGLGSWLIYLIINGGFWSVYINQGDWGRTLALFPSMFWIQFIYMFEILPKWQNGVGFNWFLVNLPYLIDMGLVSGVLWLLIRNWRLLIKSHLWYVIAYLMIVLNMPVINFKQGLQSPPPMLSVLRFMTFCVPLWVLLLKRYQKDGQNLFRLFFALHVGYLVYFVNGLYIP